MDYQSNPWNGPCCGTFYSNLLSLQHGYYHLTQLKYQQFIGDWKKNQKMRFGWKVAWHVDTKIVSLFLSAPLSTHWSLFHFILQFGLYRQMFWTHVFSTNTLLVLMENLPFFFCFAFQREGLTMLALSGLRLAAVFLLQSARGWGCRRAHHAYLKPLIV